MPLEKDSKTMKRKRLLVLGEYAFGGRLLRKIQVSFVRYMLREVDSEEGKFHLLCGAQALDKIKASKRIEATSWAEIRVRSPVVHQELNEFIESNSATISILESSPEAWLEEISVPQTLAYGFAAPHSEDLPNLIAGLHEFLQRENFDEITVLGGNEYNECVFIDVCHSRSLKIKIIPNQLSRILTFLETFSGYISLKIQLKKVLSSIKKLEKKKSNPAITPNLNEKILFALPKERSIHFLEPIAKYFKENAIFLGSLHSNPGQSITKEGIPAFNVVSLYHLSPQRSYLKYSKAVNRLWKQKEIELKKIGIEFMGVNILKYHLQHIKNVLLLRGPLVYLYIESLKSLLNDQKPRLIVSSDPLELSQILYRLAKLKSIPSLIYAQADNGFVAAASIWKPYLGADYVAVLNDFLREYFSKPNKWFQRDSKNIFIVGNSIFSPMSEEEKRETLTRIQKNTNFSPLKPIVLVLSRHVSPILTETQRRQLFQYSFEAARICNAQIVIKCHPSENKEDTELFLKRLNIEGAVIADNEGFSLRELCSISSVVIGIPESSSSMYALALGIPVVLIGDKERFKKVNKVCSEVSLGLFHAAIETSDASECKEAVKKLFHDETTRKRLIENGYNFAEKMHGPRGGIAGELILKFVKEKIH